MKSILITGARSYIGESVEHWLKQYSNHYTVRTIDMLTDAWMNEEFSRYDVIFHVAGIAHRNDASDELYEEVNHQLAVRVAKYAAAAGVVQFIFMSSGAVYTQNDSKNWNIIINKSSPCCPLTAYGKSKLAAENDILKIAEAKGIKATILRPPTVYGYQAKGNFLRLAKLVRRFPVFPDIINSRSMIYIDNLCEFIRLVIDNETEGILLPQNREYVKTSELIREISACYKKKTYLLKSLRFLVRIASRLSGSINKIFGTFYYDREMSGYFDWSYCITDFKESIRKSLS